MAKVRDLQNHGKGPKPLHMKSRETGSELDGRLLRKKSECPISYTDGVYYPTDGYYTWVELVEDFEHETPENGELPIVYKGGNYVIQDLKEIERS